ncbi:MAG: hypothetical protein CBD74_12285 [Saprospirales bacterium TMED214]|nr:MAG: hypothetical protein CBD74_12285 [Saprospirales bacterium TMED214]
MRNSNQNIKILWDGNAALVVHKPAGIATQAAEGIESLETLLRTQFAERTDYLAFPHRLDRPVSGVLLVATRKRAARLLSEQFASRKVTKTYHAWVMGQVHAQQLGHWVDHMRKITNQSQAEIVQPSSQGARVAETKVSLRMYDSATNRSLLELSPLTGRMHQLRLQTAQRGFPIIGDWQYGGQKIVDESGKFVEIGKKPDQTQREVPYSATRLNNETAQKRGSSEAQNASEGTASELETPVTEGNTRHVDRILLQAHQIEFHDPTNGTLKTVTASEELPQSV